jgi:transcriptional regulator with XRE-family HTH domain
MARSSAFMPTSSHTVFMNVNTYCVRRKTRDVKNDAMNFASNLRRLRTKAGMTQEQLAHACGFSGQSRIGNYESSAPTARQPKPDELPRIAAALGVEVGELLGEPAAPGQSRPVRLDPAMIAQTHKTLREVEETEGRKFSLEDERYSAWFVQVYAMRAAMPAKPTPEEWVEYGIKLASITTPQGAEDGRGNSVPTQGTGTGKMARKVHR